MNTCQLLLLLIWSASAIGSHNDIDSPSGVDPGKLIPATDSKAFPPGADSGNDISGEKKGIESNSDNNPNDENTVVSTGVSYTLARSSKTLK